MNHIPANPRATWQNAGVYLTNNGLSSETGGQRLTLVVTQI